MSNSTALGGCFLTILFFVLIFLALNIIMATILWIAWNLVVPTLLSGPAISFTQAFGLALIVNIVRSIFSFSVKTEK